jgi:dGTPase
MTDRARVVLRELFATLLRDIELLPREHRDAAASAERNSGTAARARVVADYVAGMTDRFALGEHRRLVVTPPATDVTRPS